MSICETLLSTYNTNILDTLSEKEKNIWKEVCKYLHIKKCDKKIFDILKDIEIKENYKKVLSNLIYNHFNLQNTPKPNYRYISGPKNCSLWTSYKYKKNIYIFGEYHGFEQNCSEYKETKGKYIEIQEYFKQLFMTTDVFIDFYLEIPSFKKEEYNKFDYYMYGDVYFLSRLRKENYKCIEPKTRNNLPECKLTRSHYIDIRTNYIDNELLEFQDFLFFSSPYLNKYKSTIDKLSISKEKLEEYIIEMYNSIIKDKYRNNKFFKWIDNYIKQQIKNEIKKLKFSQIKKELKDLHINTQNKKTKLRSFMSRIGGIIVDSYTLFRVFRDFKTEKDQPISPHNIIIYAGDYHAYTYRKFLKSIGFINREKVGENINYNGDTETITKNPGSRCLDMYGDGKKNKITQPLFSFV